jgi:TetR/AcrR family transcriptional regulator, transcriptional repressor of aconitase
MARTVDPEKHRARRLQILEAAVACFASKGFERTTVAEICRAAGISSGNLFHYFPTKAAIFAAIFEEDTREIAEFFAAHEDTGDPWGAVLAFLDRTAAEASNEYAPGLVGAVLGYAGDPHFAAVIAESERVTQEGLEGLLAKAQQAGRIRTDLAPQRLASWVALLVDGFYSRILSDPGFDVALEAPMLRQAVERLASKSGSSR